MGIPSIIKELQKKFIDTLFKCFLSKNKKEFFGKSPTGSGKTYMIAKLMDKIFDYYNKKNIPVAVVVSSLSKGRLIQQSYEKTVMYRNSGIIKNVNSYLINSGVDNIPIGYYNTFFLGRDSYKENTTLSTQNILVNWLDDLKQKGYEIILIKDEAHQATNNLDELGYYFSKVINFSASKVKDSNSKGKYLNPDSEIKEDEAVNVKLIKRVVYMSNNYYKNNEFTINSPQYKELVEALKLFLEKKQPIQEFNINPAFLIQLSNAHDGTQQLNILKYIFHNVLKDQLNWLYIADHNVTDWDTRNCSDTLNFKTTAEWEDYVKGDQSKIDVIIFKMKLTEGWDIPRANMLFQIRDSKSVQLDEQVIGRARRNPLLSRFKDIKTQEEVDLLLTAYVWGVKEIKSDDNKHRVWLASEQVKNEFQIQSTQMIEGCNTQKSNFDIEAFLNSLPDLSDHKSFKILLNLFNNTSDTFKNRIFEYIGNDENSNSKFIKVLDYLSLIHDKFENVMKDFKSNIERKPNTATVQDCIECTGNEKFKTNRPNTIYNTDDPLHYFYCDSETEVDFEYKVLNGNGNKKYNVKTITDEKTGDTIKLFGKNYTLNSDIYYEYYNKGDVHKTYPDYLMKNENDDIFLVEIKSLNGNDKSFEKEYKERIDVLKRLYKAVSSKCDHYFAIGIKENNNFNFNVFHNGITKNMTENEFRDLFNHR